MRRACKSRHLAPGWMQAVARKLLRLLACRRSDQHAAAGTRKSRANACKQRFKSLIMCRQRQVPHRSRASCALARAAVWQAAQCRLPSFPRARKRAGTLLQRAGGGGAQREFQGQLVEEGGVRVSPPPLRRAPSARRAAAPSRFRSGGGGGKRAAAVPALEWRSARTCGRDAACPISTG